MVNVWLDILMATTSDTDRQGGIMDTSPIVLTVDNFDALRADWKAQGCPSDHPYLLAEFAPAGPIVPLVVLS